MYTLDHFIGLILDQIAIIGILLLSSTANVLVAIQRARKAIPPEILDWIDHTVAFITAILSGLVCGWIAESFFASSKELVWSAIAMGGFVGHKGLNMIMDAVLSRAVKTIDNKDKKK